MSIEDKDPILFVICITLLSFFGFSLINGWWIVAIPCLLLGTFIVIYRLIYDEVK